MALDADVALLSTLAERPGDELLALIGSIEGEKVDPEAISAIFDAPLYSSLSAEGLLPRSTLNLAELRAAGRRAVEERLTDWRSSLQERLCPGYAQTTGRDLLVTLGPAGLTELLEGLNAHPTVLTLAILAYVITQAFDSLCADWQQ